MTIPLWQVPLFIGAAIVILAYLVPLFWGMRREPKRPLTGHSLPAVAVRFVILVIVAIVMIYLLWTSLQLIDTSIMAVLAAIASVILEAAAVWLAAQALREAREARRLRSAQEHPVPDRTGDASLHELERAD